MGTEYAAQPFARWPQTFQLASNFGSLGVTEETVKYLFLFFSFLCMNYPPTGCPKKTAIRMLRARLGDLILGNFRPSRLSFGPFLAIWLPLDNFGLKKSGSHNIALKTWLATFSPWHPVGDGCSTQCRARWNEPPSLKEGSQLSHLESDCPVWWLIAFFDKKRLVRHEKAATMSSSVTAPLPSYYLHNMHMCGACHVVEQIAQSIVCKKNHNS